MAAGQKKVQIFTNRGCPACVNAKRFFDQMNVDYEELKLGKSAAMDKKFAIMTRGARSVPQIFIGEEHIGGFDDLLNVNKRGELEFKLGLVDEMPKKSFAQILRSILGI